MVSLTLAITEELKREMKNFPEMNWSVIAREAIKRKLLLLREMDSMLKKSKLTKENTISLGRKVNKSAAKKFIQE